MKSTMHVRGTPRSCRPRLLRVAAGVLLASALSWGGPARATWAEDGKEGDAAAAPAPGAVERKPLKPLIEEDPKQFKELVEAARQYFDLDEEQWRGRTALVGELEKQAAEGRYFLKDMDALRWLVYEGRSFEPPLTDRKWQKAVGITEAKGLGGTLEWIKSEDLTLTFSVPRKYWKAKDFRSKFPRPDPYPLLLAMHEKSDYTNQRYPGEVLLKRRYPRKDWEELYEQWILLCPIAAAGNYLNKAGTMRSAVFTDVFAEFWRHYHIDYDRVILDGSSQAFIAATSLPVYFAGVIFREKWKLEEDQLALVKNFSPVPVYVVDNPALAEQLRQAGHENVTAGVGGKTLMKWASERRRTMPKKFTWTIGASRFDQVLPYWINVDSPNMSAPKRELQVEVLDTEKAPNTIKIQAVGINTLSIFLNDDIVDLDRKLRVEINGHVEYDDVVKLQDQRMAKIGRDFDFLFNRDPVRIRTSMFHGWLYPARIVSLSVRPPRKPDAPKKGAEGAPTTAKEATPAEIQRAGRLLEKAKIYCEAGNHDKGKELLDRLLELPITPHHEEAREMRKKLEGAKKDADGK